jgi:hypothetical protein
MTIESWLDELLQPNFDKNHKISVIRSNSEGRTHNSHEAAAGRPGVGRFMEDSWIASQS